MLLPSGLDFLGTIKLVNYIRAQVKARNTTPDVSSKEKFDDETYLKPVLEDDALLYSLGDIEDEDALDTAGDSDAERRVIELQEDLERLQSQFSEYRLAVQRSMEEQLSEEDSKLSASSPGPSTKAANKVEDAESDYFSSYSYNGIHKQRPRVLGVTSVFYSIANEVLQQSTSLCSRTLSALTPTVTLSTTTNVSSRTRLSWMSDVVRGFSPCSVPRLAPKK